MTPDSGNGGSGTGGPRGGGPDATLHALVMTAFIFASLLCPERAGAQGTRSDYERALGLREATANKVYRDRVRPQWFAGNTRFWYRNDLRDGKREFILVDAEAGTRQPAFDHERLAAALAAATGQEVSADQLSIDRLTFDEGGTFVAFSYNNKSWTCDLDSYEIEATTRDEQADSALEPLR